MSGKTTIEWTAPPGIRLEWPEDAQKREHEQSSDGDVEHVHRGDRRPAPHTHYPKPSPVGALDLKLRESHGRDMSEWPADLRVRGWPR